MAAASLMTLGACSDADASTQFEPGTPEYERAALLADYGISQINIGLVMLDDNPEAGQANDDFRQALEDHLGLPVNEIEGISHLIGLEAMRGGSIDMFLASPFTYLTGALNIDDLDLEFLVSIVDPDAAPSGTSIITSSANTHINSLADLEGESFAFVDTASLTGFLLPMYEFVSTFDRDHNQMLNPGYFFSSTILSGQHDASLMAVANGDVAGAAVASNIIDMMTASGIIDEGDIKVIHVIDSSAPAGYVVRSDMPGFLIEEMREFFLAYDDEAFFDNIHGSAQTRFQETDPSTFDHLRSLMLTLEIGQD